MKGSIWVLCDPRYKYNLFWSPYSTHNDIWCLEGKSSINTISHWYIFPFSWAKVISSAFQVGSLSVLTLLFFACYIHVSDKSKFIQLRTQQASNFMTTAKWPWLLQYLKYHNIPNISPISNFFLEYTCIPWKISLFSKDMLKKNFTTVFCGLFFLF